MGIGSTRGRAPRAAVGALAAVAALVAAGCTGGAASTAAGAAAPETESPSTASSARTPALSAAAERGRVVFVRDAVPSCVACHTLRAAGSKSAFGPDLDQLRPTFEQIVRSVTNGVGLMPSQEGLLTPEQIDDVARFVVESLAPESTQPR